LTGVNSKHDIHAARKAKQMRESQASLQDAADQSKTRTDCLKELVESGLLAKQGGLSVMVTLQKLGQEKKQLVAATRKKGKASKNAMAIDGVDEASSRIQQLTDRIGQLTSLASLLLDAYGEADIYDQTYEDVVKTLRLEGEVPRVSRTRPQRTPIMGSLLSGMGT
jgi:CD2 antigen cytoplasmic tail-binding protein 2